MEKVERPYFIFVLHRQENLFDTSFVTAIYKRILQESLKKFCVMIIHKPTEIVLRKIGLFDEIVKCSNSVVFERLDYVTFTHVLINCDYIVTDGGSNQEECYFLGKPCLVLRSESERTEGLGENVVLAGKNFDAIEDFLSEPKRFERPEIRVLESPSEIIADELLEGDI
jgi:UDP-N-acetylglucosamine 2-epimerase (non-hydrolysing)